MLSRHVADNGVVYYFSGPLRAAGIRHGFSTRIGGISPAPFDSLNLGNPHGSDVRDDYDRIWDNYELFQAACELPGGQPIRVHQAHGNEVARVTTDTEFDCTRKADAIVSTDPDRTISVRIADCVPILLAAADGSAVAAVHAGWRGVIAGVIGHAIKALLTAAASEAGAAGLLAAIGPCIGKDAFEVGSEVIAEFRRVFGADAPVAVNADNVDGKGKVDLRAAVQIQLRSAGLPAERIDSTDRCTFRDAGEFFSHRRENGRTGRMAAIIAPVRASDRLGSHA